MGTCGTHTRPLRRLWTRADALRAYAAAFYDYDGKEDRNWVCLRIGAVCDEILCIEIE